MIPALGPEGAAELHRELAQHVALEAAALSVLGEADLLVWHEGGTTRELRAWLGRVPRYRPQPEGDLGARLRFAFKESFRSGAPRAVAIGSDCPAMTADHLRRALARLNDADIVLGPATDGGYWLVGMQGNTASRALEALFSSIPWGTDRVLGATLARLDGTGLEAALIEPLSDVDRPEDLPEWEARRDSERPAVSIVIPTLREAARIGALVEAALRTGALEVIVADGGSDDGTADIARDAGARRVRAERGRARQLNEGAREASGQALLFLHADTEPPAQACEIVARTLSRRGVIAGGFQPRTVGAGDWRDALMTAGSRLRGRLTGFPYGDQGIFVRTRIFRALGGFPEIPVMEDWELVRRLKRLGEVTLVPEECRTTAQSFMEHGLLRSTLVNHAVVLGFQLGVDPVILAGWRRRIARRA
jgi:hypothetical protein